MTPIATKKSFQYGLHTVTLETGLLARQATAAVVVSMGDSTVLVTVVGADKANDGADFFPLSVHYQERSYAAGKIPGGFFKREGRPSEKETLTSRLIDRPIRPLFPEGFYNEVQVVATVLAIDPEIDADIPAMIGASAALALSGIPFNGPIGAVRVGYINGSYVLNPPNSQLTSENCELNLVVAGTAHAVLMVESEAKQLSEAVMLGAVMYGHEQMQVVIQTINELVKEKGKTRWDWQPSTTMAELEAALENSVGAGIRDAYRIREKLARQTALNELRAKAILELCIEGSGQPTEAMVRTALAELESKVVRGSILSGELRIDGRDTRTVRPISVQTGVLPRVHGSAIFTRGETQALVITTLGTERDAQVIDGLEGERKDPFMLHYNFPPYSVGETGMIGSPKRREIGHGRLAKRGIQAVLPNMVDFPYVLRVVSEITESNGSSSMASVCGTSLSLMDAGVPLMAPVAGIAMGLIKEGSRFAILTDILGDEDHLGDMDFKVAGTATGITALQMDIKIEGITREIMEVALHQARDGRLHILGIMNEALPKARDGISKYAPRIITIKVDPDKIRDIIGKGGVTIRAITEETGATIDISDDGTVKIAAVDQEAGQEAKRRIELITADVEVGKVYEGKVVKIMEFGAFVNFLPGKDGLVHISQITDQRVQNVADYLQEGQQIKVKVLEVDRQGRIRLSMKEAGKEEAQQA